MLNSWWLRLRISREYVARHSIPSKPAEPLDHTGAATQFVNRSGAWAGPVIRGSVPAPNQRPWPGPR